MGDKMAGWRGGTKREAESRGARMVRMREREIKKVTDRKTKWITERQIKTETQTETWYYRWLQTKT